MQYIRLCVFLSFVMFVRILYYYHNQNGSMNHLPLFMVKSWDNGKFSMFFWNNLIEFGKKMIHGTCAVQLCNHYTWFCDGWPHFHDNERARQSFNLFQISTGLTKFFSLYKALKFCQFVALIWNRQENSLSQRSYMPWTYVIYHWKTAAIIPKKLRARRTVTVALIGRGFCDVTDSRAPWSTQIPPIPHVIAVRSRSAAVFIMSFWALCSLRKGRPGLILYSVLNHRNTRTKMSTF